MKSYWHVELALKDGTLALTQTPCVIEVIPDSNKGYRVVEPTRLAGTTLSQWDLDGKWFRVEGPAREMTDQEYADLLKKKHAPHDARAGAAARLNRAP